MAFVFSEIIHKLPSNSFEHYLEQAIVNTLSRLIFKSASTVVKPVLSGHSKIDKTKILMTNGSLMKVKRIAECSPWSILQYF